MWCICERKSSMSAVCILCLLITLAGSSKGAVSFSDYFPMDSAVHGIKTFERTFGPGTEEYVSEIGLTEVVPYLSGPISGTQIIHFGSDDTDFLVTNNGTEVKFLGIDEGYISVDALLTGHPTTWSFSTVYDGMIVDQQGTCLVSKDLSTVLEDWDDQMLLFNIQDVTVSGEEYSEAVIVWFLDTQYAFVDPEFYGKDTALGIVLPTDIDTCGYSLTDFDIYSRRIGLIAHGRVEAETNTLFGLYELQSPVPLPNAILLTTIGTGIIGWARRRRRS